MTNEQIEKILDPENRTDRRMRIFFKTRSTITGVFIFTRDYKDMKSKNFWRIVPESKLQEWETSKDPSLSRIFNGSEFTRLSED